MSWAPVLAGFAGLVVGALAVLAFRAGTARRASPGQPEPDLPAGVSGVLAVLRSAAVVLDAGDGVLKATPAAHAFGLVRGHDLAHAELREMVAEARRRGWCTSRSWSSRAARSGGPRPSSMPAWLPSATTSSSSWSTTAASRAGWRRSAGTSW